MAESVGFTYSDKSIREDLWDSIKDLDAINTYITSNAGDVSVTQKVHSWIVDPITATTSQAGVVEGADTTYSDTAPTLLQNQTQIIEKGFKVPSSTENSDHAGFSSRFAREQLKAMKMWKNDFEYAALLGASAGGASATARTLMGLKYFASTLTSSNSGISLSSAMLDAYLGDAWVQGGEIDTVIVGRTLKDRINGFTAGNTRNVDATKGELVGRVDVYDSSYGRVKIIVHRYATAGEVVSYISDYILTGFLDKPHFEDRAQAGYYKAGAIVGEGTIQVSNEKAVSKITNLL
jgi:hypothetical protein